MDLSERSKIYLLICIYSALFSYLIIVLNFFPYTGLSLSIILFCSLSYYLKKEKTDSTKKYFFFSLIFALFIFIRSNPLVTFLNLAASVFFGTLMLTENDNKKVKFLDYLMSIPVFVLRSFFNKSDFMPRLKGKDIFDQNKAVNMVTGLGISIFVLAIVIPLLSSANPIFRNLVSNTFNLFNLTNWFKNIKPDVIYLWLIKISFFLCSLFILPKMLTEQNKNNSYKLPVNVKFEKLPFLLPKLILSIILFIFLITQLQYYFATPEYLETFGISYSQRAREVFGQLSVVAGIVMVLIYNDRSKKGLNKLLDYFLGTLGLFLVFMAYQSDFDYINAWGFTYLRLYGLTFASWLLGVFSIYFYFYSKKSSVSLFLNKSVIWSGILLILVNILNFDYLIYNFKKAATGQGVDYTYLATLSPDSLSYKDQYKIVEEESKSDKYLSEMPNRNSIYLLYKIENLQQKYFNFDIRIFNLLEFKQYLEIKEINTVGLRKIYEQKY